LYFELSPEAIAQYYLDTHNYCFFVVVHFTVEPGFYPTNWLFIGKCHLQLGKVEEGSKWLIKIATHQSSVSDDIEVRREGEGLGVEREVLRRGEYTWFL
jgi:hypothetical protein